jgi:tetrahydromethanopterin S-methyltransferase subunit F
MLDPRNGRVLSTAREAIIIGLACGFVAAVLSVLILV